MSQRSQRMSIDGSGRHADARHERGPSAGTLQAGDAAAAADRIAGRAAPMIAAVAERVLHEDPRFRHVWLRPGSRPGSIDIGGQVADRQALQLLHAFAERWGGIELKLDAAVTGRGQPARH